MSRNSCKGCEYSQKCELVKMTKEERKTEEIEEEIKKYIGGNKVVKGKERTDFGWALDKMRHGFKVMRNGWNGKGMYIWLVGSTRVQKSWIKEPGLLEAIGDQESIECLGFIRMKTADNKILSGWLASQTDMLSEDWEIYEGK